MDNIKRFPTPGSFLNEYLIYIAGENDPLCCPHLAGISFPTPRYEIQRAQYPEYTFEYIISGEGTLHVDGQTVHPKAGDVYILQPCNTVHYYSDPLHPWKKIWCNISGSLVTQLLQLYHIDACVLFPGFRNGSFLERILQAAEEGGDTTRKIFGILHEFIAALSEFMNQKSQNPIYHVRDYINNHLDQQITIAELCDLIHLSKSRLIQRFQSEFGVTPYAYIMHRKAQMATILLEKTDLPIHVVALRLGFSNPHNFSAFFKKMTGTSPRAYRHAQF